MSARFESLVEALRFRAARQPEARAFTFLGNGGEPCLTYGELDRRARAIAARLQAEGMCGQRVLLLHVPGLDFIAALYGCFYAGAVAVPAYLPEATRAARALPRLRAILDDTEAALVLTTTSLIGSDARAIEEAPELRARRLMTSDTLAAGDGSAWIEPAAFDAGPAFLQYTSGSTSTPRGVVVTHRQALANLRMIHAAFRPDVDLDATKDGSPCTVMWLPFYHDMGLVGGILMTPYMGGHTVLMSPLDFLRRPIGWLRAIARFRADYSACPNFGLELCARKAADADLAGLDLGSLDVLIVGAEPVRPETLRRFESAFGPSGFRSEAIRPAFGLAEAVLAVSARREGEALSIRSFDAAALRANRAVLAPRDHGRTLVSAGKPILETRVAIVDPDTHEACSPGGVGEIWVAGPSVAQGYWNRAAESEETFAARLAGSAEGPFLRTGDLGFWCEDELYIAGRLKDLVIVRGQNIHPIDVEASIEACHPRARASAVLAIDVDDGEALAILAEVDTRGLPGEPIERKAALDAILATIRDGVAHAHRVPVALAGLVRLSSLPRTSSGKIRRAAAREGLLAGELPLLARWDAPSGDAIEAALAARIAEALHLPAGTVDLEQRLLELGLDSLALVELKARVERDLGISAPLRPWLDGQSVRSLASQLMELSRNEAGLHRPPTLARAGSSAEARAGDVTWTPLSHGQQAIWVVTRNAPESTAYNLAFAVRLGRGTDEAALQRALRRLVARHPSLRTTYAEHDGRPVQRANDGFELMIAEDDGVILPEVSALQIGAHLAADAHRPFDLEREAPLRIGLFRLASGERAMLVAAHHIAVDLWSLLLLGEEVGALYTAEITDGAPLQPTSELATYADFVRWQSELLAGAEGERLFAYWRTELAGAATVLDLPTDRPRPPVQTYPGAAHRTAVTPELTRALAGLARQHGTTLYVALLTGFQVLLHRLSGQDDLLVGSPAAGRGVAAFSDTIGYFVNPIVLRARFVADLPFSVALTNTAEVVRGALEHQDFPFPLLVERLAPRRDPSRSPLFQVMFVFQRPHRLREAAPFVLGQAGAKLSLGALEVESLPLPDHAEPFDLRLMMIEVDDGLSATFQYNTDLFDAATVSRMGAQLGVILAAVARDPSLKIAEIPLLDEAERARILVAWNDTPRPIPPGVGLHQLFEAQAARTPDAVAVAAADEELTYRELDRRANQLARYLGRLGVGAGALVGVCMERAIELVVAIVGVLKVGAAYVPIDPSYPKDRVAAMLDDARATVILTQARFASGLLVPAGGRLVAVDADPAIAAEVDAAVTWPGAPESLAYVIFTSGSTGRPKGVMIPHRAVVNNILWTNRRWPLGPGDAFLLKSPVSFDASVLELWAPLVAGARLELALPDLHGDPAYLVRAVIERGITDLMLVPSMLELVVQEPGFAQCVGLRRLFAGGEALSRALVERIQARLDVEIINIYGPTEVTIDCVVGVAERGRSWSAMEPIGRPIDNLRAYVLDARLQPVPQGVVGELYLGGAGVARGYLGRPALTAERFVPDPFGPEPGGRLYRSGDACRMRSDGQLEFIGRLDHQVKIRGFRIELGEIEAALSTHAEVRAAVVITREDVPGEKRLVAYVVRTEGASTQDLRDHLRITLPDYMIPSAFVWMDALPLSPNGKVDRHALPAPEATREGAGATYVGPRTAMEHALVSVWEELLGVRPIGIQDDFFALGGHSLLVVRLVAAIRTQLGATLRMASLFQHPTIEALAALLDDAGELPPPGAALRPAPRAPGEHAYAGLSGTERRVWFLERLYPGSRAYQVPHAIRLRGVLDVVALREGLDALARRHELLRTAYPEVDGAPTRVVSVEVHLPLRVDDLRSVPAPQREAAALALVAAEVHTRFDLEHGPLTRVLALRLAEDEHVLLVHQHHVITDEWSAGVLVRELGALHDAARQGAEAELPALGYQYADHARAEQEALEGGGFAEARAYWKAKLSGVPRLDLPLLRAATGGPGREGHASVTMPLSASRALEALARQTRCTSFMAWYALVASVLARYSGQRDFGLGAVVANRDGAGSEALLGFFTNTVVLRTDLSGDPSFRQVLGRARQTAVDAYRYQALPFDVVVQDLGVPRRVGEHPLYDVSFLEVSASQPGEPAAWSLLSGALADGVMAAKNALAVALQQDREGPLVRVSFDTARLDANAVERFLGHLATLLVDAVAHPDTPLSALVMLTPGEHAELRAWNDTAAPFPEERCVHQLVGAQAQTTPHAVALEYEGQQLTYAELSARAHRLAHHLRALGVGPEVRVGLCVERSLDLVVGLLAILAAGGAYVPLDPTYPPERLAFMLADARVPVLLTRAHLQKRLSCDGATVVRLDADALTWAHHPATPPESGVGPENLAYVIYTSGSTGKPKGIAMPHRALSRLLVWQRQSFLLPASVPTLQFASPSFDVSFQEIFSTLTSGGALRLIPEAARLDPAHLWSLICSGAVERVFLPPVMLQHIAEARAGDAARGGRCEIITAGEQLVITPSILELFGALAEVRLHNHYGPTEAHVVSAFAPPGRPSLGPVPIGRPNVSTRLYVLDHDLAPVPVGIPGELYIAGAGLARGYLGRPGLTADRFVPDPSPEAQGARMYRTGDLARWNEQGELEFLGRLDHQVKIRGFRVELGEIEAALSASAEVRSAVVVVREDTPGERRLVAYLVAHPEAALPSTSELREGLRRSLPDYMIPSAFVWMDALPLSPNGKVDRQALPAPEATREGAGVTYVAPRTAMEHALVSVWEELLGARPIGIQDDFFALGGHSLLVVRLVAAIERRLGAALRMASVFEHPTIEALAGLLDAAGEVPLPGGALRPAPRAPGERAYPGLAGTERRVWFLERLYPGSRAYQVPQAIRVRGTLDAAALSVGLEALARRHELLRTAYPEVDGTPTRVVSAEVHLPLRVDDLRAVPAPQREAAALALVIAEVHTPFDLERGPLTRVLALRLAEDEHVLLVHQHHLITDEWSVGVLVRELGALHEAARRGAEAVLPALGYQYADHARAEQEALEGGGFAEARAYWNAKLSGVPRLDLPQLRAATGGPGPEGHRSSSMPVEASRALEALARQSRCTSFMAWYALVASVLARYSGQRDFGLGAVVANRDVAGSEALLGFFTNTIVLRTDLSGDPSFREVLRRARQTAVDAYRHQALPFDVVVQDLGVPRRVGEHPLYDVSFLELSAPDHDAAPGWSAWSGTWAGGATSAKDALGVAVQQGREGPLVRVSFDTARLDASAVERFLGHLATLLVDAVAHPDTPLSGLALLTPGEHAELRAWNDTAAPFPEERCVHQLVEAQAQKTPDAVALEYEGQQLTYAELSARAHRLAHHLRALGVGPEVRVGLCVERSLDLVVGLLAILAAGGAYVPLDPTYPPERLAFMLADARVPVLLTRAHLQERLSCEGTTVVRLDADALAWAHHPTTPPESGVGPDSAVYVIYTSGSTGRPKGAINTHRALVNRLWWMDRRYRLGADDAVLQKTPLSFDVSGWELWWPLLVGARMVLAVPEGHKDPAYLASLIRARGITTLHFVPSMLAAFLAANGTAELAPVRRVFCSGEELTPQLSAAWYAQGGAELHNLYGPTEAAIDVTSHDCRRDEHERERVPIGRPVANTRVYVLDRDLHPAPVGGRGELYLAGVQLARGYLDRPGLTADRFVPDPFADEPGARMYRTGDLGRWNEQGELEFLGRADHQVKIRGFRVELGEIEATLGAHPAIVEAVVVLYREREGEDAALAGYFVLREGAEATPEALRAHLRERLPGYMVPGTLTALDRLPLGASGKLDRLALPAPRREPREGVAVAPRDDLEALLARVLGEVLGCERVGVHDHFFDDLGGNSLSILRAASAVSRELGTPVPVLRFFEHPTVAALARGLRGVEETGPSLRTTSERTQGRRDAILRARRGGKK